MNTGNFRNGNGAGNVGGGGRFGNDRGLFQVKPLFRQIFT